MIPTRNTCDLCASLRETVFDALPDPREAVPALYALIRAHHETPTTNRTDS